MCYKCFRPCSHCLCNLIKPFKAHCNILILQHPHERKKYYSTAKLVTMALTNSTLLRGMLFEPELLESKLTGQKAYLLFPASDADDCETTELDEKSTVILLDGTWTEAGKIARLNPLLKQLPCLTFKKPLRSNYLIRRQPKENYLSTIESVGHLLKLNAIANKKIASIQYDSLFQGFSQMVERQYSYFPRMQKRSSDLGAY
jgi:DTW domain-containing protein YfiP